MRNIALFGLLTTIACSGKTSICKGIEGAYCYGGEGSVTFVCRWDEYEVTRQSDFTGCFAQKELLSELCDAGVEEDVEVVEDEIVCEEVGRTTSSLL